jgi:hypothetical protein
MGMKNLLVLVGVFLVTAFPLTRIGKAADVTVTLAPSAFPRAISHHAGARSLVTATAQDTEGHPVPDGTEVRFASTAGRIDTLAKTTAGVARAVLEAEGQPGIAIVTATCGEAHCRITVYIGEKLQALHVDRNVQWVPADGHSKVLIRAYAFLVPDGTPVWFATSHGTITPQATTWGGEATAILTAAQEPVDEVEVEARCGSLTAKPPAISFISTRPARIDVGARVLNLPADGESTVEITAWLFDAQGRVMRVNGIPVRFQTDWGRITPTTSLAERGVAVATLTASDKPGTAQVTATCNGLQSTVPVAMRGPAAKIQLHRLSPFYRSAPDGPIWCRVAADVLTSSGQPVAQGTRVSFVPVNGEISPHAETDREGRACAVFVMAAGKNKGSVTARVNDVESAVNVGFRNKDRATLEVKAMPAQPEVRRLTLRSEDYRLLPDGRYAYDLIATTCGENGEAVEGAEVRFKAERGELFASQVTTDRYGLARTTLAAEPAMGDVGVTAASGQLEEQTVVRFSDCRPAAIHLKALPRVLPADGGASKALIRAYFRDADGGELPIPRGMEPSFEASHGTVVPWSLVGPWASLHVPSSQLPGVVRVRSSYGLVTSELELVCSDAPARIEMSHYPAEIVADGRTRTYLKASVSDAEGHPVADGTPVEFASQEATLSSPLATTQEGQAVIWVTTDRPGRCQVAIAAGQVRTAIVLSAVEGK